MAVASPSALISVGGRLLEGCRAGGATGSCAWKPAAAPRPAWRTRGARTRAAFTVGDRPGSSRALLLGPRLLSLPVRCTLGLAPPLGGSLTLPSATVVPAPGQCFVPQLQSRAGAVPGPRAGPSRSPCPVLTGSRCRDCGGLGPGHLPAPLPGSPVTWTATVFPYVTLSTF